LHLDIITVLLFIYLFWLNKYYFSCRIRYTWEEEIRLKMPNVPITGIYVLSKSNEQFIDPVVVITSYDLMSRKKDMLLKFKFGIIVFVRHFS